MSHYDCRGCERRYDECVCARRGSTAADPSADALRAVLRRRGIRRPEDACQKCSGLGARMYSHGSTWRGGVGTTGGHHDVCDECWGSGRRGEPWLNLRTLEADVRRQVAERAVDALARSCAAHLSSTTTHGSIREIVAALDKLARGRKTTFWTAPLALGLANLLRRAIGDEEKDL